jgi:ADP-ribose pyrophosphatase YjhB (NUDIX family)
MPGGLVDPDDRSLYAAARRELKEESGFKFSGKPPEPSVVYDNNFFVLNSKTYTMSKHIFKQKTDGETKDFGVAYVDRGKWTVLSSNKIETVLTREIVRRGTFNQLKNFGPTVAAGFADRTLFD